MKLFAHQQQGIETGSRGSHAFFWDCGTGKTLMMLQTISQLRNQGPALVVCPLSIIETAWIADCRRFTPHLSITSLWSRKPAERLERLAEDHDIYVTNFETFKNLYHKIQKKQWGILVVDESSKLKNPRSQITRAVLSFAGVKFRGSPFKTEQEVPYRYVLSGTPAPNDESEYWAQLSLVAPGKAFSRNFYAFRGMYFHSIPLGLTGQKMFKFRENMRDEFMREMKPFCHIVHKSDALDLPDQVHQIRVIHLSQSEQTAYNTMKKDLVVQFGKEQILARTALTEIMKLRQLTSGFAYGSEGTYQTGKSKLKELENLLNEIGDNQAIIWCNFKAEMSLIRHLLGKKCDCIPNDERSTADVCKAFQDGKVQYLVANPQTAGHGLTFVNCSYAVYFSLNYSYELFKQSQDRIHRIGQKKQCAYYYLLADKTIDQVVYDSLQTKRQLSTSVLKYLKGQNGNINPATNPQVPKLTAAM